MGLKALEQLHWKDLTEPQPANFSTPVELANPIDLNEHQRQFIEQGVLYLPKFIPDGLLDAYAKVRSELPKDRSQRTNYWNGWHYPTPYMHCPEMRDVALYPPLMLLMQELTTDPMGLHLALTGWISTERNWHQDTYLNPSHLWSWYLAAWIALDDIDPDSGPFEFVPGSHKWEVLRRERLFKHLSPEQRSDPSWPTFTQEDVARVCIEKMQEVGATPTRYIPKKGDVLIWHSNLMHRGSPPSNHELDRRALICHYSSIVRRWDMDRLKRHSNGMLYFEITSSSH